MPVASISVPRGAFFLGQRSRSVRLLLDLDSLGERELQHSCIRLVPHLEKAREPVHPGITLRAHQVAGHTPGCLKGVIRIAQVGSGWVGNGAVLTAEMEEVARHQLTPEKIQRTWP